MQLSFNPNVSFKNTAQTPVSVEERLANLEEKLDSYTQKTDILENPPKPKKTFKEKIASIPKFFKSAGEIIKGTIKGIFYGGLTGAAVYGLGYAGTWGFKKDKNLANIIADAAAENAKKIKKPLLKQKNKVAILTTVAGLGVGAYHFIKGLMLANNKKASVDHYFGVNTGHNRK